MADIRYMWSWYQYRWIFYQTVEM